MMPTLFDGDFIFVSKYSYGLRLPVSNTLVIPPVFAAARLRDRLPVAAQPEDQLHQAVGRTAGRPHPGRLGESALCQRCTPIPQQPGPAYLGPKQDMWNYAGVPTATEKLGPKRPPHHVRQRRGQGGGVGVPEGHYFFMGGQPQTTARDSRWLDEPDRAGIVPERNLVGKAGENLA